MALSSGGTSLGPAPIDVKYIGDLQGSYLLSSRESRHDGEARIFSCRSRSTSPTMVVLQAPVKGQVGEKLALKLDALGLLKASINRHTSDGFIVDLLLTGKERATIASRLDWLKQRHLKSLPERRDAKRWLPRSAQSSLILADKRQIECFIIDVSTTGVAISADATPGVGHPVVVGAVLGRVIRRLESGFAVQFLTPQDAQKIDGLIAPVKESKRELLTEALAAAEAAYEASRAATEST